MIYGNFSLNLYLLKIRNLISTTGNIHNRQITELGFEFILTTTSKQINYFLSRYALFMIKQGRPKVDVINFIFELNLLLPS